MKTPPLISIITPSYNQAEFIEATLQSVLQQRYPHIEYIVVDGLLTDGTTSILEKYRHQLSHLIIEKKYKKDKPMPSTKDLNWPKVN